MVYMDMIIRCDHPGCTRTIRDEIVPFIPRFPNAYAAGWSLPDFGEVHGTPTYCPEHKGEHNDPKAEKGPR